MSWIGLCVINASGKFCCILIRAKNHTDISVPYPIKTKKNGTVYEAPAVKAVRKKPNYKIGQKINLVNCPDGEHTPDKIWIIRTEPFWFEGMWRVCIHDWIGSIPVENIKAVSKDRS